MIKGLAHLCFVVKDLPSTEAFYRDVLGFEAAFDFVNDEGKRFEFTTEIMALNPEEIRLSAARAVYNIPLKRY